MDCTYGVDHCISAKRRIPKEKIRKTRTIGNFSPVRERV